MWNYLFEAYVNERPLLGYGFNAFWYSSPHRLALQKVAGYPDPIIIADNGFIDILVNTGYIGLGLFLIFYLGAWGRSLRYASKAGEIAGFFPVVLWPTHWLQILVEPALRERRILYAEYDCCSVLHFYRFFHKS
jgi:O-antigen ligase